MSLAADKANEELEAVLARYLRAVEEGRAPDRMELLARHPELAPDLAAFFAGQDRFGRLAAPLRQAVSEIQESTIEQKLAEGGRLGDFRLIREIGRGGMGIVYEAEQISLDRRVALKVLPFASTLDAKQLQRFKNEAQAAAGLHHTNIVPIHATGCERGVHYYAMQYIEGQTLAALIRELRQMEGREHRGSKIGDRGSKPEGSLLASVMTCPYRPEVRSRESTEESMVGRNEMLPTISDQVPAGDTLSAQPRSSTLDSRSSPFFRPVANLGIQAAEALEHAHQLGVIHRDIKPANLMVENVQLSADYSPITTQHSFRLWITDFGLAHCQSQAGVTMTGDLVGTLRYMSPEQALAKRVVVDHRTDIYSLGATLYELLTLEPAFGGADRQEVLRQIAFEEPRPPRRLNKAIPAELETIVLKAIEKNPGERYGSAQELADDLRRYLEDKPIRARRPTLLQRGRKWARRHRSLVWVGGLALLLVLVASILSTVLIWNAYQSETNALKQKDVQLQNSEASLTLARRVLFETLAQLTQMQPRDDPQAKKAVEEAVVKMLNFYEEMETLHGADPVVRREVSRAYHVMAVKVFQALGEREQARRLFVRAVAIAQELADEFPDDPDFQYYLACTYGNFVNLLSEDRDWGAAIEHAKRSTETFSRLATLYPNERRYRRNHAVITYVLGHVLWDQGGHGEEAAVYVHEAIELEKQLIKDFPEPGTNELGLSDELDLAKAYNLLGLILLEGLQRQDAEENFHRAIGVLQKLITRSPLEVEYRQALASAHNNLGEALHTFHDLPAAEHHLGETIQLLKHLTEERPVTPNYEYELALAYNKLGGVLGEKGQSAGALKQYGLALEHLPKSVTDILPEYRWERANGLIRLGHLLSTTGQSAKAEEAYKEALPICEELAAHFQEPGRYGEGLANCSFGLAHLLVGTGHTQQAKEICGQAFQLAPKNLGARARLAWLQATCADAELRDDAQALKLAEDVVKAAPKYGANWRSLGAARYRTGDSKGAIAALQKSMKLANGYDESFNTFFLAMAHWRLGDKKQARQWYDQGVAWMKQNLPYDEELCRFQVEAAGLMQIQEEKNHHKDTADTKKPSN
jgi:serine/threonine protein kinase/Flp pilus assembly protein TadD